MGRGAPDTFRRKRAYARRWLTDKLLAGPALGLMLHLPWPLVRFVLRRVLDPLAYRVQRKLSEKHLTMVFGEEWSPEKIRKVGREVSHNFVRGAEDMLLALRRGPEIFDDRVHSTEARAVYERFAASWPGGYIGVTGHLGNWELLGNWVQRHLERRLGAVIAKRMTNPWLGARIQELRLRLGLETYFRDESPRKPLGILRRGEGIATVPDQDVKGLAGIFIPFFGRRAYTPIGPARLAIAAKVPLLVCAYLRRPEGGWKIVLRDPVFPDPSLPRDQDIERLTRAWSAQLEEIIREHPEQWAWFHERWRTTPEYLEAWGRAQRGAGADDAAAD